MYPVSADLMLSLPTLLHVYVDSIIIYLCFWYLRFQLRKGPEGPQMRISCRKW